jgi:cation:H+ antiporter
MAQLPLALNLVLFAAASAVVWIAGTRLSSCCVALSDRTGLGKVFMGTLLLGMTASLPEMVTSLVASARGQGSLALNTLLGGVTVTMAMLALADLRSGWKPLSSKITRPVVPLEGMFVVLALLAAAVGVVSGDRLVLGSGVCTILIGGLGVLFLWVIKRNEKKRPWVPSGTRPGASEKTGGRDGASKLSTPRLALITAAAALAVALAGFVLAIGSEAISTQTGIGAGFIGFVLGGVATSLPEASTLLGAVKLRQYEMAFGDAFGTNLISAVLLLPTDVVSPGGPLLSQGGRFALLAILLGIALTSVYLVGLLLRRRHGIHRIGVDSLIVLLLFAAGSWLLYRLR